MIQLNKMNKIIFKNLEIFKKFKIKNYNQLKMIMKQN